MAGPDWPAPGVDDEGNVHIHGRGGLTIHHQETDENGEALDISGQSLFWEIEGVKREALAAGADDYTRLIQISIADVAAMTIGTAYNFVLIDETGADPDVMLSSQATVYGYRGAP